MSQSWNPVLITEPTDEATRAARGSYETMLVAILDAMLERYERDRRYHFIDTKLNLITGEDFAPGDDPARDFKSKRVVFGWIQGRGLESLAGHARWLADCAILDDDGKRDRIGRLREMMADVLACMEARRLRNHGRVTFMMTTDGQPLGISDQGTLESIKLDPDTRGYGDMFYAKGLYAAAHYLGLEEKMGEAEAYFRAVIEAVETGAFATDQQPFDPRNKVRPVPGRRSQGPHMIGLFGISLVAGATGSAEWLDRGCRFIERILAHHVVHKPAGALVPYDFVEAIGEDCMPWVDGDGAILCDPGHALECVGAMARFLHVARELGTPRVPDSLVAECRRVVPRLLVHVFRLAYNNSAGGICKTYDLASRKPQNDDMPWWSLPETIRSAALLLHLFPDLDNAAAVRQVLADSSNAFLTRYVNPAVHLMAYQTRNSRGEPIDVIPGTPDADPGYHTGLAIIDFLRCYGPTTPRAPEAHA